MTNQMNDRSFDRAQDDNGARGRRSETPPNRSENAARGRRSETSPNRSENGAGGHRSETSPNRSENGAGGHRSETSPNSGRRSETLSDKSLSDKSLSDKSGSPADVLVEIKDLRTYFYLTEGTVRAVDGVDLTIKRGRTLGVVGESGCGKSMTAMSLMRLVPSPGRIESGELLYYRGLKEADTFAMADVIDLAALDPNGSEIRNIRGDQISMVFQEPMTAMSPVRTVGKQITEAIILHQQVSQAEARKIAIDILARVKMPNPAQVIDDYPFQLSGGMRQRAVIAMALSCHPSLLIADEPTTALDVTTEAQILDLMRELQKELGMAIMYITHNLGVIAEMAEEVAVMYLGKVVEQASVETIFFKPKHPYTRALLKSIPQLDDAIAKDRGQKRLETIEGMVPDPYSVLSGCSFHPRCPEFMPGVCDQVVPGVIEIEPGHIIRCHLYGSAKSDASADEGSNHNEVTTS